MLLLFTGVRPFYAARLAMAAVSTGGFLPFDRSLDEVVGTVGLFWLGIFLVIGATSVFWHKMVMKWQLVRLKGHRESYAAILLILLLGFAYTVTLVSVSGSGAGQSGHALVEGFMNGASLVATSGMETRPGLFALFPLPLVLFIILVLFEVVQRPY